jgi:hypothetical protein
MRRNVQARHALVAVAVATVCGAVLAACGSVAPSTSSSGGGAPTGAPTSSSGGTSSGTTALPSCPTGAALSAAIGSAYPTPTVQSDAGFLTCTYSDATDGANLVITATTEVGVTASTIQAVAQSQAAAQGVTASSVSGLGDAAFSFTLNDSATNFDHIDTTSVEFIQGSSVIDITAEATLAQIEAVGHLLIGQ